VGVFKPSESPTHCTVDELFSHIQLLPYTLVVLFFIVEYYDKGHGKEVNKSRDVHIERERERQTSLTNQLPFLFSSYHTAGLLCCDHSVILICMRQVVSTLQSQKNGAREHEETACFGCEKHPMELCNFLD